MKKKGSVPRAHTLSATVLEHTRATSSHPKMSRAAPTWNLSELNPELTLRDLRSDLKLKHWAPPKNSTNSKKPRVGTLYVNSKKAKGGSPLFILGNIGSSEETSNLMYLPFGASRADEISEKISMPVRFPQNAPILQNFKNVETALKESLTRYISSGIPGYEQLKKWADSLTEDSGGEGSPFTMTTSGTTGTTSDGESAVPSTTRMTGPLWDAVNEAWSSKIRENDKYDPFITLQMYESNVNPREDPNEAKFGGMSRRKKKKTLVYEAKFPSLESESVTTSTVENGIATLQKGTRGMAVFEASQVWFKTQSRNGVTKLDACGVILTLRSFVALKNDEDRTEILEANFNGIFQGVPAPPTMTTTTTTTSTKKKRTVSESSFANNENEDSFRTTKKRTVAPPMNVRVVDFEANGDQSFDATALIQ